MVIDKINSEKQKAYHEKEQERCIKVTPGQRLILEESKKEDNQYYYFFLFFILLLLIASIVLLAV